MFKTTAQLKNEAKQAMAPQQKNILLMTLIFLFLFPIAVGILGAFIPFGLFFTQVICGFIAISYVWRLLTVFRQPETMTVFPLKDITKRLGSPDLGTVVKTGISRFLFTVFWGIIPIFIGIILIAISGFTAFVSQENVSSIGTILLGIVFIIVGFVLEIIKGNFSYSLAYYLAYDEMKRTGVSPSFTYGISASKQLINRHKGRLFWLHLTFIGWWLLCLITFGLAAIYVIPYFELTKIAFYEELLEKRQEQKNTNGFFE